MHPVLVEITERPADTSTPDIELVDDLDAVAGSNVMRSCGDVNPYG